MVQAELAPNPTLAEAFALLERGFSIIPLRETHTPNECRDDKNDSLPHTCPVPHGRGSKEPALPSWKEYYHRRPTPAEVQAWFSHYPNRGIGIVCGEVSAPPGKALVGNDFDDPDGFKQLLGGPDGVPARSTLSTKTRRGYHVLTYANAPVRSERLDSLGLDIQAEKKYLVAPPTIHPMTGKPYRWHNVTEQVLDVGDFTAYLRRAGYTGVTKNDPASSVLEPFGDGEKFSLADPDLLVLPGNRHSAALSLAGALAGSTLSQKLQLTLFAAYAERHLQNHDGGAPGLHDLAELLHYARTQERTKSPEVRPLAGAWEERYDAIERLFVDPVATRGLSTGFSETDDLIGGLEPATVYALVARPGNYKSDVALQWAYNVAATAPVFFFSLEMPEDKLLQRLAQKELGITLHTLRQRGLGLSEQQRLKLKAIVEEQRRRQLYIIDERPLGPQRLTTIIERSGITPSLVVVDYINLMREDGDFFSRERQLSAYAEALADLATSRHIPVLLLAQLNRSAEGEGDPTLAMIREADLGIRADVVLFSKRMLPLDPGDPELVKVGVLKQKDGPANAAVLYRVEPQGRKLLEHGRVRD